MLPLVFVVFVAASVIGIRLARRAVILRRQRQSVLPLSYHPLSKRSEPRWGWAFSRTSATIWTKALNTWPEWTVKYIGRRSKGVFIAVYDLGAILACAGSLLSIMGLLLATSDVWYSIFISQLVPMSTQALGQTDQGPPAQPFFEPIIPGITRPFSHLPILVLALLVNQGIHEAGHALSAACDGVSSSIVSIGFVGFLMPMASVSFDGDDIDELDKASSMRLAAAGPLHNFGTWIVMLLLGSLGAGSFYLEDVSARGVYVRQIRPGSELSSYLPDFAVITHVDLKPLNGSASTANWGVHLAHSATMTQLTWTDLDNSTNGGVVTWEGSRSLLLGEIDVSDMAPRTPRRVSSVLRLYFQYFVGMALSLALFNLLPFPHSDGSKLLTAAVSKQHEDLESGRMRMHLGRRVVWVKTLEWTVIGTAACYGIGQVVLQLVA